MPLRSMTGFARSDGSGEGHRWTWELRSVNGKSARRSRSGPAGFRRNSNPQPANGSGAVLTRGNVQATLSLELVGGAPGFG